MKLGARTLYKKTTLTTLMLSFLFSSKSWALRAPDMSGDDQGATAVYNFDEMAGDTAFDSSGQGAALDLKMSTAGNLPTADGTPIRINALFQTGALLINPKPNGVESGMPDQGYLSAQRHRTFLVSDVAASKLSACTTGFAIQVFLRPWFPFQGSQAGNMIVGLSNSEGSGSLARPNFALYQSGEAGSEAARLEVRTGANSSSSQTSAPGAFSSTRETDNPGKLTEIIATQEPSGVLTVYVNRIARSSLTAAAPVFSPNAKLVIGNEQVPLTLNPDGTINVDNQKNWSGEIHHLAIYCQGFTRAEILGATLQNKSRADVVRPQVKSAIDSNQRDARRLVERLSGVTIPVDHPMVLRVTERLSAGDRIGAAKIVTGDVASGEPGHPEFLNTVVKQFAVKMSNREETIRVPLNDFAASVIGVTRDERSAQELLTGNFLYIANPAMANVRSDYFRDILVSNNHFEDLEKGGWDIGKVLLRVPGPGAPAEFVDGQKIAIGANGETTPNPDPAGILTSRAFMSAHAIAGTNRRLVEYAFREFMCMPMSEMADTSASPARIGRDIDRLPGGDATKFETSCKGCHSVMDGFRGAFAKFDFTTITLNNSVYSFVRNTQVSGTGDFGFSNGTADRFGTVRKMNHNETVFPNGYTIVDDSFVNNAVGTVNRAAFGWGGPNKVGGAGVNQFGRMLADSTRFQKCMAKHVFEAVCTPGIKGDSVITPAIEAFATRFKDSGFRLRSLFQDVSSSPECAQGMGR